MPIQQKMNNIYHRYVRANESALPIPKSLLIYPISSERPDTINWFDDILDKEQDKTDNHTDTYHIDNCITSVRFKCLLTM